jgi:hypothetical protein
MGLIIYLTVGMGGRVGFKVMDREKTFREAKLDNP